MRRYKAGVYAIPYEGEEVKLYWANADQYYIKTAEAFQTYTFALPSGRTVHFRLCQATTARNNNKATEDGDRRFVLAGGDPVVAEDGALVILFEYRPVEGKPKQAILNKKAVERLLALPQAAAWAGELSAPSPTEANAARTLLEKHLTRYTARNTFDYFIHKDLGAFLRRELDFYLKSEVVRLDDFDTDDAARADQYLSKVRAIKRVAHRIIDFLAQIEDFQKRLFLKKKLVLQSDYCLTLDRVPDMLYPEVAANAAQIAEWKRLFAIEEIAPSLLAPAYGEPLTEDFLRANQSLVLDTRFFDQEFKRRLLASFDDLDAATDGLIVCSENFQALNLLLPRYQDTIKCIYIDPPYNTGNDGFLYKDNYQHSSWLCMMSDRLRLGRESSRDDGVVFVSIDDIEVTDLRLLLNSVFLPENRIESFIWKKSYGGGAKEKYAVTQHEYVLLYARQLENVAELWLPPDPEAERKYYKYRDDKYEQRGPYRLKPLEATKSMDERKNLIFPIPLPGGGDVWPKRQWWWKRERVLTALANDELVFTKSSDGISVSYKQYLRDEEGKQRGAKPFSIIDGMYTQQGTADLAALFGNQLAIQFPKPVALMKLLINMATEATSSDLVLDFFAGSGTTGQAVIELNREDGGNRKYVLVEMGDYFDTVLKPRLQKVIYSKDWKDGKPVSRAGTSHMFKYLRLEQYEDTLNNLELRRTAAQQRLLETLDGNSALHEDYYLRYMLNLESRQGDPLLTLAAFDAPFDYKLKVADDQTASVDLVETFNYLLGLSVARIRVIDGFTTVRGRLPNGETALVIWRDPRDKTNDALAAFVSEQGFLDGGDLDRLYVNGDHTLEAPDSGCRVLSTEAEFLALMFDGQAM